MCHFQTLENRGPMSRWGCESAFPASYRPDRPVPLLLWLPGGGWQQPFQQRGGVG